MSVKLEAVSLLILSVLFLFHYDRKHRKNLKYRLFALSLVLSIAAIFLDIVSALAISCGTQIPHWIHMILNTAYFTAINLCFNLVVGYSFYLLFEHTSDHHCLRQAIRIVCGFLALLLGTVVVNLWTGCLFYFEDGMYVRGPLNRMGYFVLLTELGMFCVCYLRNRDVVSHAMHRLMRIIPPIVLLLAVVQLLVPDILLNGTLIALISLIYFVNFQSVQLSQDALTELPNRTAFFEELEAKQKKRQSSSLILLRLEHYEAVNRKVGRKHGDNILFKVAKYLDGFSEQYQAFRFGNARFALMASGGSEEEVRREADRLKRRFEQPWREKDAEFLIETAIGCMVTDPEEGDENRIIDQLEYAADSAGENGSGEPVCFDQSLKKLFARRDYVLKQIQRALETEAFEVYYQPLYDCSTGKFTTAESLLRLFDENGTMISPGEFIPLAEEEGLIDEISWIVLRKVCGFLEEYPDMEVQTISINMSVQQLEDWQFLKRIRMGLETHHLTPDRIRIEITERVMMENPKLVQSVMKQITGAGVKFYLDDFGIGYSNLANMMSLPFETIKLDASLIQGAASNGQRKAMLGPMIQMLHNAGLLVVAEGVETKEEAVLMRQLGVDRIQGYYYAKPMGGQDLIRFLQNKGEQDGKRNH